MILYLDIQSYQNLEPMMIKELNYYLKYATNKEIEDVYIGQDKILPSDAMR